MSRSGTDSAPITVAGEAGAMIEATVRIEGSHVRLQDVVLDGTNNAVANGIYITGGAHDVEVCGVEVRNQRTTSDGPNPQGVFTSSSTARVHLINVSAHHNGRPGNALDHGMYLSGSEFLLANVLLYENAAFGVQFYDQLFDSVATHITTFSNNLKSGLVNAGDSAGNRVYNSIGVGNAEFGFEDRVGDLRVANTLGFGNGRGDFDVAGGCTSCSRSDPLLDESLRPQQGSPAIDRADPSYSPGFDYAGRPRGVSDIGALESTGRAS